MGHPDSTKGYVALPTANSVQRLDVRYLNKLSYSSPPAVHDSEQIFASSSATEDNSPGTDLIMQRQSSAPGQDLSPPKYTVVDTGYRVGAGGMLPKRGIYWSPSTSPKLNSAATLDHPQQRRTSKVDVVLISQPVTTYEGQVRGERTEPTTAPNKATGRRRFQVVRMLRKLSSSSSSSDNA